nr:MULTISPECIES: DUF2252 domain-containing protein [unclassified Achromobacter]
MAVSPFTFFRGSATWYARRS